MIVLGRDWKKEAKSLALSHRPQQVDDAWISCELRECDKVECVLDRNAMPSVRSWTSVFPSVNEKLESVPRSIPALHFQASPLIIQTKSQLCFPGRKKQWGLSSSYSGSKIGPNCSISTEHARHRTECLLCETLSHSWLFVLFDYHTHKPHLFLDLRARMGSLL